MLTPQLNPDGYAKSAVSNMTGFENTRYLLVHGTGDDNGKLYNTLMKHNTYIFNSSLPKLCCIG